MRNFVKWSISSSFFDRDPIGTNGFEFAFPANVSSLDALLENREMLGMNQGSAPGSGGFDKNI